MIARGKDNDAEAFMLALRYLTEAQGEIRILILKNYLKKLFHSYLAEAHKRP
jgi:hypothetical protein